MVETGTNSRSKPKKVVHYLWSAGIGGIEKLVFDLAVNQNSRDEIDVAVLFGSRKGQSCGRFQSSGLEVLESGLKSGSDVSLSKLRRLIGIFRAFHILHLHGFHPLVSLAAKLSGRRIVYTEHGVFGIGRKQRIQDPILRILKKVFLNGSCDFITFNSQYTRNTARKLYGLENLPQSVVFNGTDLLCSPAGTAEIDPAIALACRGKFVIGTCSRFVKRKRIDRLIDAFTSFSRSANCVLLLVGDGPSRTELEAQAERHGLTKDAVFAGYRTNITDYQNLMDVCVFPAEKEPFGLVAIETLALGKPTIVFRDGGGLTEIIQELEPEDVVPNVSCLVRRLEHYYLNKDLDLDNARNKRRNYVRNFSIENMADKLLSVYESLSG